MSAERNIPQLDPWMHPEVAAVRGSAPLYLREVRAARSTGGLDLGSDDARLLPGGIMSACYLISRGGRSAVVKFRSQGTPSEAEALQHWGENGCATARVIDHGIVPSTTDSPVVVTYMIQEAILDESGNPAPTAAEVIREDPTLIPAIATIMGQELAKIHETTTDHPYGSTNVVGEFNNSAPTWQKFLEQELEGQRAHLLRLGFNEEEVARMSGNICALPFPDKKTYIHNDFNIRNALVESREPLRIRIIDPNPMIGDRHWDLAYWANKLEYETIANTLLNDGSPRLSGQERFVAAFEDAYTQASRQPIEKDLMLACQLLMSLKMYAFFIGRSEQMFGPLEGDVRFAITEQMVRNQAKRVLALAA